MWVPIFVVWLLFHTIILGFFIFFLLHLMSIANGVHYIYTKFVVYPCVPEFTLHSTLFHIVHMLLEIYTYDVVLLNP